MKKSIRMRMSISIAVLASMSTFNSSCTTTSKDSVETNEIERKSHEAKSESSGVFDKALGALIIPIWLANGMPTHD